MGYLIYFLIGFILSGILYLIVKNADGYVDDTVYFCMVLLIVGFPVVLIIVIMYGLSKLYIMLLDLIYYKFFNKKD